MFCDVYNKNLMYYNVLYITYIVSHCFSMFFFRQMRHKSKPTELEDKSQAQAYHLLHLLVAGNKASKKCVDERMWFLLTFTATIDCLKYMSSCRFMSMFALSYFILLTRAPALHLAILSRRRSEWLGSIFSAGALWPGHSAHPWSGSCSPAESHPGLPHCHPKLQRRHT